MDRYVIYVSRDIMILGISISITFIFLDVLQKFLDSKITEIDIIYLIIGLFIIIGCSLYLIVGALFDWFRWLRRQNAVREAFISLSIAFLIESSINLLMLCFDIMLTSPSFGKTVNLYILIALTFTTLISLFALNIRVEGI